MGRYLFEKVITVEIFAMTLNLTYDLDPSFVNVNQCAKYQHQKSFCYKVIV